MVDPNCFVIAQSVVFIILEQQWVTELILTLSPCFDIKITESFVMLPPRHPQQRMHSSPTSLPFPGTLVNSCGAIISVNTRSKCWRVGLCSWLTSCSVSRLSSTSLRWVAPKMSHYKHICTPMLLNLCLFVFIHKLLDSSLHTCPLSPLPQNSFC